MLASAVEPIFAPRDSRIRRRRLLPLILLLGLLSFTALFLAADPLPIGWRYRREIWVTNLTEQTLNNYQVCLSPIDMRELVSSGKMRSDASDVRFAQHRAAVIYYSLETTSDGGSAIFCLKAPIVRPGKNLLFMYYGNRDASATASTNSKSMTFEPILPNSSFEDSTAWSEVAPENGLHVTVLFPASDWATDGKFSLLMDGERTVPNPNGSYAVVRLHNVVFPPSDGGYGIRFDAKIEDLSTGQLGHEGQFAFLVNNDAVWGFSGFEGDKKTERRGLETNLIVPGTHRLEFRVGVAGGDQGGRARAHFDNLRVHKLVLPEPTIEVGSERDIGVIDVLTSLW